MSRVVGMVCCLASIEFILDTAARETALDGYLTRQVGRSGAHGGHAKWELGVPWVVPTPMLPDPADVMTWLHPLCRQTAVLTDADQVEQLAQQCRAEQLEDGQWAFTVWAQVLAA